MIFLCTFKTLFSITTTLKTDQHTLEALSLDITLEAFLLGIIALTYFRSIIFKNRRSKHRCHIITTITIIFSFSSYFKSIFIFTITFINFWKHDVFYQIILLHIMQHIFHTFLIRIIFIKNIII